MIWNLKPRKASMLAAFTIKTHLEGTLCIDPVPPGSRQIPGCFRTCFGRCQTDTIDGKKESCV